MAVLATYFKIALPYELSVSFPSGFLLLASYETFRTGLGGQYCTVPVGLQNGVLRTHVNMPEIRHNNVTRSNLARLVQEIRELL